MTRNLGILVLLGLFVTWACTPANDNNLGGKRRPFLYMNIVSLSPSTTELFTYVAHPVQLKGRTAACDYPSIVLGAPVVAGVKPDYEKIAEIKPDLVLVDDQLYSKSDMDKIRQLGAKVYDWNPATVDEYVKDFEDIAVLLGGETKVSVYLDKVRAAEQQAEVTANGVHKTAALISPDPSGHELWCGVDSFQADEMKKAQLTPIGPSGANFVPLDAEKLIKADPDFLLLVGKDFQAFVDDPRFKSLKALKANHVVVIPEDVAYRRGVRVDTFISDVNHAVFGAK
jgi:iron complex transport system substrate-binding protein